VKTFKLSNDKQFVDKVQDVVGLYLAPPDRALVLSVDEKSQIQALDRNARAIAVTPAPSAHIKTIRARQTSFCGVFRPATQPANSTRSAGDSHVQNSASIPRDSHPRENQGILLLVPVH
jgi:hypothetical protein